MYRTTSKG